MHHLSLNCQRGIDLKALLIVLLLILTPIIQGKQTSKSDDGSRTEAERLWELAVAAKGGRERLYSVESVLITTKAKYWFGFFQRAYHNDEELYVFPDRCWLWFDARPSVFGLNIESYDTRVNSGYQLSLDDQEQPRLRKNEMAVAARGF